MRAKTIYESINFQRGLDPKKSMSVGKEYERLQRLKQIHDPAWLETYIDNLAQDRGGAFEIYLSDMGKFMLAKDVYVDEKKLKIVDFDYDDFRDKVKDGWDMENEEIYEIFKRRRINKLIEKGWTIFHEEENGDFVQFLLTK